MPTNYRLCVKNGTLSEEINPYTDAGVVAINDENGVASTVAVEIVALRQNIASAVDAGIHFRGAVNSTNGLPTVSYKAGWQYAVQEAGTYAGQECEVGDYIICIRNYASGSASNADWIVIQKNIVGAVIGPASSVALHVAVFSDASGKNIADSGFTIGRSVPADAVFTDTTYAPVSASADGLMTVALYNKLVSVEHGADKTDSANVSDAGAFMISTHTADNITDGSSKVVMTASERTKLSNLTVGAEVNQAAFSNVKVGSATVAATGKTDTIEYEAGDGVTISANVGAKKLSFSETYIDSCIVNSLDEVPANLRNGGVIFLRA